jgi:hypothetical protein
MNGRHDPESGLTGSPDEVRDALRAAAAEPGGNRVPIVFSERQRAVLDAITDEIVPPGEGFPAPSEVHVVEEFFTRYVAPAAARTVHFPGAAEEPFKAMVDEVAPRIEAGDRAARIAVLQQLERTRPEFFGQLRALTYAGYYSRRAVVLAIRELLEAGRDYNGPPLPYGYDRSTHDWSGLTPPAEGRYTPTGDVQRVTVAGGSARPLRP